MKRIALVFSFVLAGCNDSGLERNSIPPIAGIVGGPDAPGGNGNVAMEITTTEVEPGSQLQITSDRDGVAPVNVEVFSDVEVVTIRADIGDLLTVRWEPAGGGSEETPFEVRSPRITRFDGGEAGEGAIQNGDLLTIEGFGFCHTAACNRLEFDGLEVAAEIHPEPRPGVLVYSLGTNLGLTSGPHTARVRVANSMGEAYASNEFVFTFLP